MDRDRHKPGEAFRIGAVDVLPARGEIHVAGDIRRVEPRVMDVLSLLASRQGEVVSRDALIEHVWRGAIVSDDVISRCVYQLRKEIDDSDRSVIKTVPKRGYCLTVPVTPLDVSAQTPTEASTIGSEPARNRRWVGTLAAGLAAIALVVFALTRFQAGTTPEPGAGYTLAVTPLAASETDRALGTGLADEILNQLSRNQDLIVLAQASSFRSESEITSALGDSNLVFLEGEVVTDDDLWIVDVRLVDAGTGGQLWSTRLATEDFSISDIQNKIELGVLQALGSLPDALILPDAGFTNDDLEAYRALLQGREQMRTKTPQGIAAAIQSFGRAAGLDPDYAAAYVSLAEARAHQVHYTGADWAYVGEFARDAIGKGLALAPDSAHANAVNGLVHYLDNDMELAVPSLKKAIELNPGYAEAHMWLGRVYMAQGRIEEAMDAYRLTTVLSPLSATSHMNLGMAYSTAGRYADAVQQYEKALELEPGDGNIYWAMAYANWHQGKTTEALRQFAQAESHNVVTADFFAQYALASFDAGVTADGIRYTDKANQLSPIRLWTVRARWAKYLNPADIEGLVREFESLDSDWQNGTAVQMRLASAYAVAGRWADSAAIYDALYLSRDWWFLYHWDVDWGFSHALMLANVRRHLGQPYDEILGELRDLLTNFAEQPASSSGMTYLHASIAAFEGDAETALEKLVEAHEQGWRRWWWTDVDPSWAELRGSEAYKTTVAALRAGTNPPPQLAATEGDLPAGQH